MSNLPLLFAVLIAAGPAVSDPSATSVAVTGDARFRFARGADRVESVETVETRFLIDEGERRVLRVVRTYAHELNTPDADVSLAIEARPIDQPAGPIIYSMALPGCLDAELRDGLLIVSCGPQTFHSWRIHSAATGGPLFQTEVPLAHWVPSRDGRVFRGPIRYAGFYAPPDDDPMLTSPNLVGQVSLLTPAGVVRYLLLDDDALHAALLRSYWDESRELQITNRAARGKPTRHELRLRFEPSSPGDSTLPSLTVTAPIVDDRLELARARLPGGLRLVPRAP